MGSEYDALNAMPAAVNFYLCVGCFAVFRLIISVEQNWEELRLWYHRRRYSRFLRATRQLRL
jgi:hypothetical protein